MSSDFANFPNGGPFWQPWIDSFTLEGESTSNRGGPPSAQIICVTNIDFAATDELANMVGIWSAYGHNHQRFFTDENIDIAKSAVYSSWRGLHFLLEGDTLLFESFFSNPFGVSASGWMMPITAYTFA